MTPFQKSNGASARNKMTATCGLPIERTVDGQEFRPMNASREAAALTTLGTTQNGASTRTK
jgi:hypothetical protein